MNTSNRNAYFVASLIERINQLPPSGKSVYTGDPLIEREAVLREINTWAEEYIQPVHYWEKVRVGDLICWRCTGCKSVYFVEPPQREYFCPGCGVPMKEAIQE